MGRAENLLKLKAALDGVYAALEPLYPADPVLTVKPKLAVVSYFRDGALWARMGAPAIAIINPHNGPGDAISSTYTAHVAASQAAGTKVVCYAYSSYGARPLNDVKADITRAKLFYPSLNGIFVDEVNNAQPAYYAALDAHITATFGSGALTILNPGVRSPDTTYASADIVMSFEGTAQSYRERPAVVEPKGKAWHCVHSCLEAEVPEMIKLATERGAAYLHVGTTTYSVLPPFFEALVQGLE